MSPTYRVRFVSDELLNVKMFSGSGAQGFQGSLESCPDAGRHCWSAGVKQSLTLFGRQQSGAAALWLAYRAPMAGDPQACPRCGSREVEPAGVLRRHVNPWVFFFGGWFLSMLWSGSRKEEVRCTKCDTVFQRYLQEGKPPVLQMRDVLLSLEGPALGGGEPLAIFRAVASDEEVRELMRTNLKMLCDRFSEAVVFRILAFWQEGAARVELRRVTD